MDSEIPMSSQRFVPLGRWYPYIVLILVAACSSTTDRPSPLPVQDSSIKYMTHQAVMNAQYLHLANIGAIDKLQENLHIYLFGDVLALSALLEFDALPSEDRERIQKILTLIAVQNEVHPVPSWKSDPRIMTILDTAVAQNPEYAKKVRARNWTKPGW